MSFARSCAFERSSARVDVCGEDEANESEGFERGYVARDAKRAGGSRSMRAAYWFYWS
jgi:hypothetical protein